MFTAHHIYKSYNLDTILEDVCFSIGPGERVGLIGPNGCGKTTTLKMLKQTIKEEATIFYVFELTQKALESGYYFFLYVFFSFLVFCEP